MSYIPVEDQLKIQNISSRYAFYCDTAKYDQVSTLFAENANWDETVIGMPLCEGREKIHTFFCTMYDSTLKYVVHINCNHVISDYDGVSARGTIHLHCEGNLFERDFRILGYYEDAYIKQGDQWFFSSRKLTEIAPSTGFTA